ncbi:hypothetical protein DCCM_3843 [Desulfocucumis palustris]|uniref:Uncharacterized protein n=1 Tax=Desulfocucumis palustris TaxID=1898651 RepID=A0A2L2XG76_9FIRM|nr:hypothetical protein DCCM_3843 [Desulfocucumis palustris]
MVYALVVLMIISILVICVAWLERAAPGQGAARHGGMILLYPV